jgi:hypothetical protein
VCHRPRESKTDRDWRLNVLPAFLADVRRYAASSPRLLGHVVVCLCAGIIPDVYALCKQLHAVQVGGAGAAPPPPESLS